MLCCRRAKASPQAVLLLNGVPLARNAERVAALNRRGGQVVRANALYLPDEGVPASVMYPHEDDRSRAVARSAVRLAQLGGPVVVEIHDPTNARLAAMRRELLQAPIPVRVGLIYVSPTTIANEAPTLSEFVENMLAYGMLMRGAPQRTPYSQEFIPRKSLDSIFTQAFRPKPARRDTGDDRVQRQLLQEFVFRALGLDDPSHGGVWIEPRFQHDHVYNAKEGVPALVPLMWRHLQSPGLDHHRALRGILPLHAHTCPNCVLAGSGSGCAGGIPGMTQHGAVCGNCLHTLLDGLKKITAAALVGGLANLLGGPDDFSHEHEPSKGDLVAGERNMPRVPPVDHVDAIAALFPYTKQALETLHDRVIKTAGEQLDAFWKIEKPTPADLYALDYLFAWFRSYVSPIGIVRDTHPNKEIRETARDIGLKISKWETEHLSLNKKLNEFLQRAKAQKLNLTEQGNFLLTEWIADSKRSGLDLPDPKLKELLKLAEENRELGSSFQQSINEDAGFFYVSKEELDGLSEDFISNLKQEKQGYKITLDYPTILPIIQQCKVSGTRQKAQEAFERIGYPKNEKTLVQILQKAKKISEIVGYPSPAHLQIAGQMAKSPERVAGFLSDLMPGLLDKWEKEFDTLKKDLPAGVSLNAKGEMHPWDYNFTVSEFGKKNFNLDTEEVRKYFPVEKTLEGLFTIYEKFFDLRFERVSFSAEKLWDPTITIMAIYAKDTHAPSNARGATGQRGHATRVTTEGVGGTNHEATADEAAKPVAATPATTEPKADEPKSNDSPTTKNEENQAAEATGTPAPVTQGVNGGHEGPVKNSGERLLGHVVCDLFPREGKYRHACCHQLVVPFQSPTQGWRPGLCVMLANFPKPTEGHPALMAHSDVVTFFHEFGHCIQFLFAKAEYIGQSYSTKTDFVELPSQFLEEWMWQPSILRQISSHYQTGQHLPDQLITALVGERNRWAGHDTIRQIDFGLLSLTLYGPTTYTDTHSVCKRLAGVLPHIEWNENSHFECRFGHLVGYGASYYGYLWSKVFALDIFETIMRNNGLLDPKWGRRYAHIILGGCGARDPNVVLRDFLGRDPTTDAFLRSVGVPVRPTAKKGLPSAPVTMPQGKGAQDTIDWVLAMINSAVATWKSPNGQPAQHDQQTSPQDAHRLAEWQANEQSQRNSNGWHGNGGRGPGTTPNSSAYDNNAAPFPPRTPFSGGGHLPAFEHGSEMKPMKLGKAK